MAADTVSKNAHRVARYIEVALLFLTGVGIAALIAIWVQLDSLLAPDESTALVRARLLRGIFSLAVPLVILLFMSNLRIRIARLLNEQNANSSASRSAVYMWFLVVAFLVIILAIDAFVITTGFQDIEFK